MSRDTYNYKRKALVTARDFGYSEETIDKIKNAYTNAEISRIMRNARLSAK